MLSKNKNHYPASPILELVEGSRIVYTTFLPDPPPELGEIDDVAAEATFVIENSGCQADNRERTDDPVG